MKLTVFCAAVALVVSAAFGQGRTLWQDGGVQLCGPSCREAIAATSDSAGGAIVVWTDARNWPEGVYAQRVSANGVSLWTENGVLVCDSTGYGRRCVTDDGKNGAIVVWSTTYDNGPRLAARRVRADGVRAWGPDGVILRPWITYLEDLPALVRDGHGGAIVVWNANSLTGPGDSLIACRLDSGGMKRWETVVRVEDMFGDGPPDLCEDGAGGVIIAWDEYDDSTGRYAVRAQRVDSAGTIRWDSSGVFACTLSTSQGTRACVAVGASRFIIGWFGGGGGAFQHRAQMFDLVGNRLWGLAGAPISGVFNSTSSAVGLSADCCRQSVWLWSENRTGTKDIFAQKLDSTGARCWDSTGIWIGTADTVNGDPFSATVDGRGGAIAAWPQYRGPGNWDTYAQHVDSAGHLCWSDTGLAVCGNGENQYYSPAAVTDRGGGAIIAWEDGRGVMAQRVADGAGIAESHIPQATSRQPEATVVRGVLRLANGSGPSASPSASASPSPSWLLDAAGRTVLELHSGANDVRALAPGVYFVCEGPRASSRRPLVVRKVIITE
jgi:hypothetical protein